MIDPNTIYCIRIFLFVLLIYIFVNTSFIDDIPRVLDKFIFLLVHVILLSLYIILGGDYYFAYDHDFE